MRTFLTSGMPRCCIASLTAAPCGSSTAALGVTTTLAFIAPNLGAQCSADNDVLGRKTPSKTFSQPLLVAIHGFTASGITAAASAGRRTRLIRQKLSHAHHCRSRVGYHLLFGRWFILTRFADRFTATQPAVIEVQQPAAPELA